MEIAVLPEIDNAINRQDARVTANTSMTINRKWSCVKLILVLWILLFTSSSFAGPIDWYINISDSTTMDLKNNKKIQFNPGDTIIIDDKISKDLKIDCSFQINGQWHGKSEYTEALRFFCMDKKTKNIFDYGMILQCSNSSSLSDMATPAVYNQTNKKMKIVNIMFTCKPSK